MREELDADHQSYSLREAFSDLRWLKEKRVWAKGLEAKRLDDCITGQRQVVIGLFRAHNKRRRDG